MRPLRVLLAVGAATALVCTGVTVAAAVGWQRSAISTADQVEFSRPLAIPPLAESRLDPAGRRVFELTAGAGRHDFGTGPVDTWGFNGDYLGPTLRAARGEEVVVHVHNQLDTDTSVHWHGMRLPAAADGGPHQSIAPGTTWSPSWRLDQPASSLWYHPHPHGATESHVYRGLAGMFLVDDDLPVDLPDEYGVDDIPVILQDKKFDRHGGLDDRPSWFSGVGILGDTTVVNGTLAPYLDVTTEVVRLRLLNAATARSFALGFTDDREFALVGTDGGLLPAPHRTRRVMLSPGERAEVVVAMRAGERAVLRSDPPELGVGITDRLVGGADTFDVLELRAADQLAAGPEVPDRLVEVPRLDPAEATTTREFRLADQRINGEPMDLGRIDFTAAPGSVEVWELVGRDGQPHNFHVHDAQFQVLSIDGTAAPPELRGWKDTVYLPPDVTVRIVLRFGEHTDPDTPLMYHCHLLSHEDAGMMGQFTVAEPGQRPTGGGHLDHD